MRYLYLFMEIVLYGVSLVLYLIVFSHYRYRPVFEKCVEAKRKTHRYAVITFLALFFSMVLIVFFVWRKVGDNQPHHIGYFTSFFVSGLLTLAFFHRSIPCVDLKCCLPSMIVVWIVLLVFEAILIKNSAGWIYTDSTVLSVTIGGIPVILENLIVFYVFAPFMAILLFTGLAENRSDKHAFGLTIGIIAAGGIVWEYLSIGVFHLWYMVEDRSVLPFNLFNAPTTIEEMLYYLPFAALSICIYLLLYYRKYHYPVEKGNVNE